MGRVQEANDEIARQLTRENLDLSIFNRTAANQVYARYTGSIIDTKQLLTEFGFPGLSFPSDNAYKHLARYSLDVLDSLKNQPGEGIHPGLLTLLRSNFNIKEFAASPEDLSIGKSRLRNPASMQNLYRRTQRLKVIEKAGEADKVVNFLGFDMNSDVGKIKTILTLDSETTGLSPESRVRNFALVRRRVRVLADGSTEMIGAPEVVMSKHFRSDFMDVAQTYSEGRPVPLSVGTIKSEMGAGAEATDAYARAMTAYEDGGKVVIEDFRDIIRAFLGRDEIIGNVDVIEGHNALAFDIDKLSDTITSQPAFNDPTNQTAKELKMLLREFNQRRAGPLEAGRDFYYAQDTLDSTKISMEIDRAAIHQQVLDVLGDDDDLYGTSDILTKNALKSQVAEHFARHTVYRSRVNWDKKCRVLRKFIC